MKQETPPSVRLEARLSQETEIIRLSIEGQRQIAASILNPPAPTRALQRAAKRYRELFRLERSLALFDSSRSPARMIAQGSAVATTRLTGIFRRK